MSILNYFLWMLFAVIAGDPVTEVAVTQFPVVVVVVVVFAVPGFVVTLAAALC